MKKAAFFLLLPVLLVLTSQTFANESSVNISSEKNASATVKVENSFNSTSSNTTNSHTKVRIETNGEVKEYESNSGDDVIMESSDGSSKVTLKNNTSTDITAAPGEEIEKISAKTKEEIKNDIDVAEKKQENLFEKIKDVIIDFLGNLF